MSGKYLLSITVLFFTGISFLHAQEQKGNVHFVQDSLIEALQQARIRYAQQLNAGTQTHNEPHGDGSKTTVLGFRIQIYTGSSRETAYDVQASFKSMYPDISTYISYTQPNYRVKVGDFRSRNQANALMSELKKRFSPVFLFTEEVNVYN